jgi:hypothetical protein
MLLRPVVASDGASMLRLAERLTIGVAPWREAHRVRNAVISWVRASLASPTTSVIIADLDGGER